MPTLREIAAMAEDLYKKDYAKADDYFDSQQFMFMACSVYSGILLQEYRDSKMINKQMDGFSTVDLSQDLLVHVESIVLKEKDSNQLYVCLENRAITFPNDPMFSGVQRVVLAGNSTCGELRKTSPDDTHLNCLLPETNAIFYYVENGRINFLNNGPCKLEGATVKVYYLPEPDHENENMIIPQVRSAEVITTTLQIMFGATEGTISDKTNDQNPNTSQQTELNIN